MGKEKGPVGSNFRGLIVLVIMAMLVSACGAGSDSVTDAATAIDDTADAATDSDGDSSMIESAPDAVTDASDDAMDEAMEDDAEEAMVDDAMEEEPAMEEDAAMEEEGSGGLIDDSDRTTTPAPQESGLFEDEAATEQEDARLADNRFADYGYRTFIDPDQDPESTFALDVDTGSYTVTRRWLDEGQLPPREAVRVEEFVNAFDYDYDTPRRGLEISVDGGPSPFDEDNHLVRVGIQGEIVDDADRPSASLTFVVDTSGSMDRDDRLGLVKESLNILVDELSDDDTVAIVTYADQGGIVLEPTAVRDSRRIYDAINNLQPGGSTNLEAGLRTGYGLASESMGDGINRVVLASDGVANVGMTDPTGLANLIRDDADRGIQLVTIGYGMGNFNDVTMEQLADQGDGFYAYVDTKDEAERLFEDELTSTLVTVAIDAKVQVVFDADIVDEYRLIGFENRGVLDSDFRNDAVDAGELGAGHQVTAMYEVELARGVDLGDGGEIGEVFLRWEDPDSGEVREINEDIDLRDVEARWADTPEDFKLATVVTTFGEVLRDNPFADAISMDDLLVEAERLDDQLDTDQSAELVDLIARASSLR